VKSVWITHGGVRNKFVLLACLQCQVEGSPGFLGYSVANSLEEISALFLLEEFGHKQKIQNWVFRDNVKIISSTVTKEEEEVSSKLNILHFKGTFSQKIRPLLGLLANLA
jgi:hypothetical protein